MSNSVVTAAAAVHAKKLAKNEKLAKHEAQRKAAADEQVPADKDEDNANVVQAKEGQHVTTSMSDVSLAGNFTFGEALADAAGSASLVSIESAEVAQSDGEYGDDDDAGISGTLLLVGAVALVGLGVAILVGGGGSKNEAPAFANATQAKTTAEDTPVTVTATATDPDGDPLTYTISGVTNGTVTGSNGSYTFTPTANFSGNGTFTVTATDPDGLTTTQTVTVTVTPVNDAPVADDENTDALTVNEDESGTIVIAYTDPEGSAVTAELVSGPENGTLTENADGTYTYTPDPDFSGTDEIVYTVSDGTATTTVTVPITVTAVNDAPEFGDDDIDITVDEGTAFDGTLTATDAEDEDLTFSLGEAAENGTVEVNEDGTYTYTPDDDFLGDDSFTVIVTDETGDTDEVTVNVSVLTSNVAPSFDDDSIDIDVDQDTAFTGELNASDDNDDDLTYTVTTDPENGEVVINDDGTFTFTPTDGFTGDDSFVITVDDGRGGTDTLEVNVSVDPAVLEVSIDRGTPTVAVTVPDDDDADPFSDAVTFTDDASVNTNVIIDGFGEGEDDIISVIGADVGDYSFSTGTGPGGEDDLQIVFNNVDDNAVNLILLVDVLNGGFVGDYETAAASVGYDFMTFG